MAGMSEASLKWATSGIVPNSTISNTYGPTGNTLRAGEQMMGSGVETRIPAGQFSTPPSYGSPSQAPMQSPGNPAWDTPPMYSGTVPAPDANALRQQRSQSSVGTPKWTPQAQRAGYIGARPTGASALPPMNQEPVQLSNVTSPQQSMQSMFARGNGLFGEERYGNI